MIKKMVMIGLIFLFVARGDSAELLYTKSTLKAEEILIIANSGSRESLEVAEYYCSKRGVPNDNILALRLDGRNTERISREGYDTLIAKPVRNYLLYRKKAVAIRCLLMMYDMPYHVGRRGPMKGYELQAKRFEMMLEAEKKVCEEQCVKSTLKLRQLQGALSRINGTETNASVDSELSMVLYQDYELYRWCPNVLKGRATSATGKTMMVCRLDAPLQGTAKSLIDMAIMTEATGLRGNAYIDARGMFDGKSAYSVYDRYLRDTFNWLEQDNRFTVTFDDKGPLFQSGQCPKTALYCGWYSVKKYIDAFDFIPGAIGYHIASFEAATLRDPASTCWCPAMLMDGITATLGPVAEPYLQSFPNPKEFFEALTHGYCLVEAFYNSKPYNSWMMVLIGDPLYRPFKT